MTKRAWRYIRLRQTLQAGQEDDWLLARILWDTMTDQERDVAAEVLWGNSLD